MLSKERELREQLHAIIDELPDREDMLQYFCYFITEKAKIRQVNIDGIVCGKPLYKEIALGRKLCNVLIAVEKPNEKTEYVSCNCWGENATICKNLCVGTHISVNGTKHTENCQGKEDKVNFCDYEINVTEIKECEV